MEPVRPQQLHIPGNIVQVLFKASNSTTFDNALEVLIRVSKSDEGRSNLTTKGILPLILELIESLIYQSSHHLILLALRLLRNLCVGEAVNQNLFIKHNGVKVVFTVVTRFGFDFDETRFIITRAALQVLANVSLAGNYYQCDIWNQFYPNMFVSIARVRKREICDPLSMIIYTCVDGSVERFVDLCKSQGLAIVAELIRTASEAGFQEDWLKLLLSRICLEESHFFALFTTLSPDNTSDIPTSTHENNINALFTSEQAFFLHILSQILNERLREITINIDFALHVFEIFKSAISSTNFHIRAQSDLPTANPSLDVLGYSLTLLRDICAGKETNDIVTLLVSRGLLDELLSLLRELELPSSIRTTMKSRENEVSTSKPPKVGPYKGFRRDIVAIIGNCAYGRKNVQDTVRDKNGIILVLQQCVVDDYNPFLREWGIWSARNLLEGNEENQQRVAELEMRDTLDVPELVNMGLRVEVDPNTKRAKLVNVS